MTLKQHKIEEAGHPRRMLRNSAAEHEAHMVRVQNSQRRGHLVPPRSASVTTCYV